MLVGPCADVMPALGGARVRYALVAAPLLFLVCAIVRDVGDSDSQVTGLLTVDGQGIVQRHDVELGLTVGEERVVLSGIDADDRVIVNGLQRARPGNPVNAVTAGQ